MGGSSEFTLAKRGGGGLPSAPADLTSLLAANAGTQDEAWARFLRRYSDHVLGACRSVTKDPDVSMDHYAYVLEALRRDDCRRLRGYRPDGRTQFTTWLSVVCRRLCVDRHRSLNGRASQGEEPSTALKLRRRLQRMAGEDLLIEELPGVSGAPDAEVRRKDVESRLERAKASLTEEDRLLLSLRFDDEAPVREIADLMGFPSVFHVYRRLKKVLGDLRTALVAAGVEDPDP